MVAYVAGSAFVFVAKTLIVARAMKAMPEYAASLSADPGPGGGYW